MIQIITNARESTYLKNFISYRIKAIRLNPSRISGGASLNKALE